MKMSTLTFLFVLTTALSARADNWLQNGDFADGMDHWRGEARTPADMAPADPFAKPDPLLAQGIIMPLKPAHWIKLEQDFRTKTSDLILSVTYKVSPDFALSTKPEDYVNVADQIHYDAYKAFNFPTGKWLVFLADLGGNHGTYFIINPKLGSSEPQTFRGRLTGLVPYADKTLCLAFPPGTGTVVLLNVSLTDTASVPADQLPPTR